MSSEVKTYLCCFPVKEWGKGHGLSLQSSKAYSSTYKPIVVFSGTLWGGIDMVAHIVGHIVGTRLQGSSSGGGAWRCIVYQ